MGKAVILAVEDDKTTAQTIESILRAEHYDVTVAGSANQARGILRKGVPDLILLDRNLPDEDGVDLCRELRASSTHRSVPVLFLTGRSSVAEKVLGLRLGGDDYLAKPFSAEELVARVDALLRRSRPESSEPARLEAEGVKMNVDARTVEVGGKEVELTNREFDLLRAFLERPDRVLTRMFLLSHVWGYGMDMEVSTKAVDMVVLGLRKKLGKAGDRIEPVKGHGYRFRKGQPEG